MQLGSVEDKICQHFHLHGSSRLSFDSHVSLMSPLALALAPNGAETQSLPHSRDNVTCQLEVQVV